MLFLFTLLSLLLCPALHFALPTSVLHDEEAKGDLERFNGKIPFLIAHFVTGYQKDEEGCPGVMISNGKARGMVVWSRRLDAPSVKLIEAIEKSGIDDEHVQTYLVGFDTTPEKVSEAVKELKLKNVLAGSSQPTWEKMATQFKLDAEVETVVFLADGRELKRVWVLKSGKFDEKKRKEIEGAAVAFLTGGGK